MGTTRLVASVGHVRRDVNKRRWVHCRVIARLRASLAIGLLGTAGVAPSGLQRAMAQDCSWADTTPNPSGPIPRRGFSMAFDSRRGVVVLFAGSGGEGSLDDTWEWNGQVWDQRVVENHPSPRYGHAMAYDNARGVTVLFGGINNDGTPLGDTWEWDGEAWIARSDEGPPRRYYHAIAYDAARGESVLFGGTSGGRVLYDDTWVWTGGTWQQRSVQSHPSPRALHAMAFDNTLGVTVLFGGAHFYEDPERKGDTWEWNGIVWTRRCDNCQPDVSSPSRRAYHALAFSSSREAPILFGGFDDNGRNRETWAWSGNRDVWTRVNSDGPSSRYHHAMADDSARQVVVLFGGTADGAQRHGDTWEYFPDCNCNGSRDDEDIQNGTSDDRNANGIPDECEPCEFVERFKVKTKENRGRCKIRASVLTTLPKGTQLTFCFEGDGDCGCRTITINDRGRAKHTCVALVPGEHRVFIWECPEDLYRMVTCSPQP
ncbi:MAG: hypothetical protein FLDDKLPJ_02272 [Phycisphaerae bacterium]|nr:hypothetical protein [Phycisphaerae bacterium]